MQHTPSQFYKYAAPYTPFVLLSSTTEQSHKTGRSPIIPTQVSTNSTTTTQHVGHRERACPSIKEHHNGCRTGGNFSAVASSVSLFHMRLLREVVQLRRFKKHVTMLLASQDRFVDAYQKVLPDLQQLKTMLFFAQAQIRYIEAKVYRIADGQDYDDADTD